MGGGAADARAWASPNVGWEARTAATRYLCAAAHLRLSMVPRRVRDSAAGTARDPHPVGRAYARRVLRGPGIIAPSPGVDTAWVIRHCHASWTQTALRDCCAAGALIACGYFFPVGTGVWMGLIVAALILSARWPRLEPRQRRLDALLLLCVAAAVVSYTVHGGRDSRTFEAPLAGLCVCVVVFAADAFAVWFRLSRLSRTLAQEPGAAFPFGSLPGELDAASELHRGNVVFYERDRVVGAGTSLPKRTLTTPIDEPKEGGRVRSFKAYELLDHIASHLRRQGIDGDGTAALPALGVKEVLAKPVSQMKGARLAVSDAEIRAAADRGPSGGSERAYVVARTTSWDGELTGSIFVSVTLEGRFLRLVVLPYYLAPVVDELRVADGIAARGLATQLVRCVPDGMREIWQILSIARSRMIEAGAKRARRRERKPGDGLPPAPITNSLREAYAKDIAEDLHQREDAARMLQIMEQRVFAVVESYLDEHGIATARFRAQVDQVINSYITFSGDNNNVAVGSGAAAGNGAPAGAPAP